jgi:glutamate racemase
MEATAPIGIFDSGIGGLTIAHAVTNLLPHESLIYFGDTAHLPYGDKSAAAIQAYSIKICNLLLQQKCKVILIACNSASAAATELLKEYTASRAKVINVIDPTVEYLGKHFANQKVGLIGTKQTVNSNIYKKKTDALDRNIELHSLATPLLAPMIEEGFCDNNISETIISQYLTDPNLAHIQALILGCTHYPLIKKQIDAYYKKQVTLLDSSLIVAQALSDFLTENQLHNPNPNPQHHFYVSDYTQSFEASTRLFFGENLRLEHYPLWE